MALLNKTVGNEIFLQGKYLSVGVNSMGNIGTRQAAPIGIDHDLTYARVGLLADTDGFGTGKAAIRDTVVRGAPIEGFNIGYKTGGKTFVHSNQELDGLTEIAGKGKNASTPGVGEADWNGATTEKLAVDQKITLTEDAKFIRFEVVLTNNSSEAMADLKYMRTVDPDLGETFATVNKVVKQGEGGALITAAATATSNPMFLYSSDSRAVVTSHGFINENPYDSAVSVAQKVGTVTKTDMSINLNFTLGTLGAGASTTVVYYMGVTDNLNETIAEIDALGTAWEPSTPAPNAAPEANNDALTMVSGEVGKGNVLANDTDANKDALTAKLKTGPANGTVTIAEDGSYVYQATDGFAGKDSFTYTVSDGKTSSTATVSVTVAPKPNAAPDANNDALTMVSGDLGKGNVLANDTDANKDALTAKLKTGPANGTVTIAEDGSYVYQATDGFAGKDSFTYTASDGKTSSTATVSVTVAPKPNAAPEANNDALTMVSGEVGTGNVLANDIDANKDALTAKLKTGPANGTVTIAEDGSYVYQATDGFAGKDSFTYTASDGKTSSTATVSVTVSPKTNAAPEANNDALTIVSGDVGKGNVLANDIDANKDTLIAKLKTGPANGTVAIAEDGSYVYQAVDGFSGKDSFTYTASDATTSSTATVSVTVNAPPLTNPNLPNSNLVQRVGTLDGSDSGSGKLTGIKGHNSFFFDHDAKSGTDQITNFERDDVLVLKGMLADGNGDGLISLSKSKLSLGGADKLTMTGVSALRYLGTDETGLSVYANAAVKPKGAIEGTIGDDLLGGALPAAKKAVFFYDTGLDIDLGNDRIGNFDNNDLLVTTTALGTTKLDSHGAVTLAGASGDLGTIDLNAGAVGALEFDGSVTRSGVTYYVYSQEGSSIGLPDLAF